MRRIGYIICCCMGLLLGMACTSGSNEANTVLQKALEIVDNDSRGALLLLESTPYPQSGRREQHMEYVVTLTQARYMEDRDITADSLILDAQRYFAKNNNAEMAARASFYAAAYWHMQNNEAKVLEYILLAHHFSKEARNLLFQAKCAHWLADTYYEREAWEPAQAYYEEALALYSAEPSAELYMLYNKNKLGAIYLELNQPDKALSYFTDGLETARIMGNRIFESSFLHNAGIAYRMSKQYDQAKDYFHEALSIKPESEDSLRIFINFSRLYRVSGDLDSTIYYLDIVKDRISEITYPYTRRSIYRELMLYYENENNLAEMKRYGQLLTQEEVKINEMKNQDVIRVANDRFEAYMQQADKNQSQTLQISIALVIALLFVLLIFGINNLAYQKRFKQYYSKQVAEKLDHEHFLLLGTRLISRSVDNLFHKRKRVNDSLIRKQFLLLRATFQVEMANQIRTTMRQFTNGAKALVQLATEDLCIIHLSRLQYSDKEMSWLLGYEHLPEDHIAQRRQEIRHILEQAGLANRDIELLMP